MTQLDPAAHVLAYGTFAGKTLQEAHEEKGLAYVRWLAGRARKTHPDDADAAEAFCAQQASSATAAEPAPAPPAEPLDPKIPRGPKDIPQAIRDAAARHTAAEQARRAAEAMDTATLEADVLDEADEPRPPAGHAKVAAEGRTLLEVLPNRCLVFPGDEPRGGAGTLVYDDDPFLAFKIPGHAEPWSQRYKLKVAENQDQLPTPLKSNKWAREVRKLGYQGLFLELSPGNVVPIQAGRAHPALDERRGHARLAELPGAGVREADTVRDTYEAAGEGLPDDDVVPSRVIP